MNALTEKIIGAAIEVHRSIGPGLLESAYEECLAHEMQLQGLNFVRQAPLPVAVSCSIKSLPTLTITIPPVSPDFRLSIPDLRFSPRHPYDGFACYAI